MRIPIVLLALPLLAAPSAAQVGSSSTLTGVSNAMNPAISVNGLFWAQASAHGDDAHHNGIALQEAEAQFSSIVDPFWKANLVAALHPAHAHEGEEEVHAGLELHLEEAFIDGRLLPAGLALRVGKFFLPFGKHVPLHTHQFPFVEAPIAVQEFLGAHCLSEVGLKLGVDLPLPWYAELSSYAVNGDADLFDAHDRDLVYGARWTNLVDVTASSTLELSGSLLQGPGGATPGGELWIYGADLCWKWISATRSHGPAATVTAELILPHPEERRGDPVGWYGLAQMRVRRNWWVGATFGQAVDFVHDDALGVLWETKANLTFVPSEFSALRAEVSYLDDRVGDDHELRFLLQANFTIGSHPAHLY